MNSRNIIIHQQYICKKKIHNKINQVFYMNITYKHWPIHYIHMSGRRRSNTNGICSHTSLSALLVAYYNLSHNTKSHSYLPLNLSYCKVCQRFLAHPLPDWDHNNSEIVRRREDLFFLCIFWFSYNAFSLYSKRQPVIKEEVFLYVFWVK